MARSFNGTSDYLTTGNFSTPSTPASFAAWYYTTSTANDITILCAKNGGGNGGLQFRVQTSTAKFQFIDSNVAVIATSSTLLSTTNAWKFAGATYDNPSGNVIFYYGDAGGVSSESIGASVSLSSTPNGFVIGAAVAGGSDPANQQWWPGRIAEVAVWNVVLTAAEMNAMGVKGYSPAVIRPASIVEYWPLVRDLTGVKKGGLSAGSGTSVIEHPRIIYPKRKAS